MTVNVVSRLAQINIRATPIIASACPTDSCTKSVLIMEATAVNRDIPIKAISGTFRWRGILSCQMNETGRMTYDRSATVKKAKNVNLGR